MLSVGDSLTVNINGVADFGTTAFSVSTLSIVGGELDAGNVKKANQRLYGMAARSAERGTLTIENNPGTAPNLLMPDPPVGFEQSNWVLRRQDAGQPGTGSRQSR